MLNIATQSPTTQHGAFLPLIKLPTRQPPVKSFICAQATLNDGLVNKVCGS
jgi:hypothetical protein